MPDVPAGADLRVLDEAVVACTACPRLVGWRGQAAAAPPRRFLGQRYHAAPVPGFGDDPGARLLVLGLAPAAHGANRTGRMFTGDRSGDWLYAALHRAGLASQASSTHVGDGLELHGVRVSAAVRCAPPANRPLPVERDACRSWLTAELRALPDLRAVLCLGAFAWDALWPALAAVGRLDAVPRPRPRFGHEARARAGELAVVGSYHPSQQNTFTGRLTEQMLDSAVSAARGAAWTGTGGPPAARTRVGHGGRPSGS